MNCGSLWLGYAVCVGVSVCGDGQQASVRPIWFSSSGIRTHFQRLWRGNAAWHLLNYVEEMAVADMCLRLSIT